MSKVLVGITPLQEDYPIKAEESEFTWPDGVRLPVEGERLTLPFEGGAHYFRVDEVKWLIFPGGDTPDGYDAAVTIRVSTVESYCAP